MCIAYGVPAIPREAFFADIAGHSKKMTAIFRPAREDDMPAAYAVFRRSIIAYLHRTGLASVEEAADPPIQSAWLRQADWIRHFWATAAENWVATDEEGTIIGWALSVVRGGHLELAFFFVDPEVSARGLGTRLLELVFTSRPETARTIMATQDPSALSLYLRSGLGFVASSFDICVGSQARPASRTLSFRPVRRDPADIATIRAIEGQVLGLDRPEDIHFLIGNRPGWIASRDGLPVGYAFGAQPLPEGANDFPPTIGPVAALDDADLPDLLDQVIGSAPEGTELNFGVPMRNGRAIDHLLRLRGKIDPFYIAVLSTEADMQLDRYVHTSPAFII